ncbi:MAG: hypothetical protein R3C56_30185 [Pirellulaceae bacterium]
MSTTGLVPVWVIESFGNSKLTSLPMILTARVTTVQRDATVETVSTIGIGEVQAATSREVL